MTTTFLGDIVNSFKMGSMTDTTARNIHGTIGIVGLVMSVALLILGSSPMTLIATL